jgi:signal recognition particle subunit SRP54
MFDNLTERLGRTLRQLRGRGRLTEDNIKDALREVRMALLEADVALPAVRDFIERVRVRGIGQEVMASLTPGQALVKVVRDELVALMGEANESLDMKARPPAVILMAGLQGSGKTTSVAKLARWLRQRQKKTVLVSSVDVYRPAAIEQLETLAKDVGAEFYRSNPGQEPVAIAQAAVSEATRRLIDVVIVDTAGRLHVDADMMDEIRRLHAAVTPAETLFVVDSMTGQDAANSARAFNDALPLTGVVLTKADGDARGGAALSVRHITGKPIKFLGVGEKTDALETFHPDRIASRILGMGDVLSLIEKAEQTVDRQKAQEIAGKLKKGKGFDLEDFRDQLSEMRKLGGLGALLDTLPGASALPHAVKSQMDDREVRRMEAIINSMTRAERRHPDIVKSSRKRRIAAGSGTEIQDVNRLLKQFVQVQKMMKRFSRKGGIAQILGGLRGRMPPGMRF